MSEPTGNSTERNRRILIVDDDRVIHKIIRNILTAPVTLPSGETVELGYEIDSAFDGREGAAMTATAVASERPYALAFVDFSMPPGWDGFETAEHMWTVDPHMQIVLCTAAQDIRAGKAFDPFKVNDQLIILKKPFEGVEVFQLANALTAKWQLTHEARLRTEALTEEVDSRNEVIVKAVASRLDSEKQLRENEELLRLITDNAGDLISVLDTEGKRLYCSPSYRRILGVNPEELIREHGFSLVHPDDLPKLERSHNTVRAGCSQRIEYRLRHADETWRDFEATAAPIYGQSGRVEKYVTVARDITQRKRMAAKVLENQRRFESLISNIPGAVYRCEPPPDRHVEFISDLIWDLTGHERDEFTRENGLTLDSLIHPDDRDLAAFAIEDSCRRNLPYIIDYRVRRTDDTYRWVHEKGQAVKDDNGDVKWLEGVIIDITERKQQEEEMRRLHQETEYLFASMSAVLIGVDVSGHVARWNTAAEKAFGIKWQDARGRLYHELPIKWDWDLIQKHIEDAIINSRHREIDNIDFENLDGGTSTLNLIVTPSKPGLENRLNFILLGLDVTARRNLETQLRQAQKLESIGQLAAGIAHEINTPTQFIGDNLRFLQDSFTDIAPAIDSAESLLERLKQSDTNHADVRDAFEQAEWDFLRDEVPRSIEEALAGVERVSKIVTAMKEFSHPGGEEKTSVNLNHAIESTITVARNEWKYIAELDTDFDEKLPPVPCHPGELNQVFLNLIVNAAHAIADKIDNGSSGTSGHITITTRHQDNAAEIRVADTGGGIPESARSKIFDPFFTTKDVGKGTGQGLAISRSVIVDKHGGTIDFETRDGEGTTFVVRLPLNQSDPPQQAA